MVVLAILVLSAVFADLIAPYAFDDIDLPNRSLAPTLEGSHFFGTDKLGRDYFSRILFGLRTSLWVALIVSVISTFIGTIVGGIAGYRGGRIDNFLMRVVVLFLVVPFLAILLILSAELPFPCLP